MHDLHLLRPEFAGALVPVLLVWLLLWRRQDRIAPLRRFIDSHLLEHLLIPDESRRRVQPIHLMPVVGIVTVLALCGPSWQREPSPFAQDQAGLVILLKASSTMDATDVQPSRMERATQKVSDLLELREGGATGLIAYGGSAHLVMPLTRDRKVVATMAAEISPAVMPVDGDALGEALAEAERLLDRAGASGSVLVVADAVARTEVDKLREIAPGLPVQFLAVQAPAARTDPGLREAASRRGRSPVAMTADTADVHRIAERARSEFRPAPQAESVERWRDGGYFLVPLIALLGLAWSRRGWVVT
jgi:Ca-activated chloride channel family protein